MENLTAGDFKANMEIKDQLTKEQRVKQLYPDYFTIDYALPIDWIKMVVNTLDVSYEDVTCNFVWLYPPKNHFGQPAPLSLQACGWLITLEG